MRLMDYLGHHDHPLPPTIDSGSEGNIHRHAWDAKEHRPLADDLPKQHTRPGQAQKTRAAKNRIAVLRAIHNGASNIMDVAGRVEICKSSAFNHITALEQSGLVRINNRAKPFRIRITAAGQRELAGTNQSKGD